MSANKALWERVCMTNPAAVKPITGKQYQGNSPKPYWIVERLTEEFGPCGIGWGFSILNERMERLTDSEILHVAVVRLWYILDDKRGELEQIGQTKCVYEKSKGGLMVDEDAPKKSVTDALIKCASYIGFAGDIFAGRWDDSKYVAEARAHYAGAPEVAKPEKLSDKVPNFGKVSDLVMDDNEALEPAIKEYLDNFAESIKEKFTTIGPKKSAEWINTEKLEAVQLLYLSNLLPTPMRNAIKTASHALNQKVTA